MIPIDLIVEFLVQVGALKHVLPAMVGERIGLHTNLCRAAYISTSHTHHMIMGAGRNLILGGVTSTDGIAAGTGDLGAGGCRNVGGGHCSAAASVRKLAGKSIAVGKRLGVGVRRSNDQRQLESFEIGRAHV